MLSRYAIGLREWEPVRRATGERPYSRNEITADRIVHFSGIALGFSASAVLLMVVSSATNHRLFYAGLVYVACLSVMLVCSAAYHLSAAAPRRALLQRLDHIAIYLIIAGSYTPLTIGRLPAVWDVGMTAAVWAGALVGTVAKLVFPAAIRSVSVALYLTFGWFAAIPISSLLASLDLATFVLIIAGGILYSIGAIIHLWRSLPYHTAIWHGLVVIAAGCHYAAILLSIVSAG